LLHCTIFGNRTKPLGDITKRDPFGGKADWSATSEWQETNSSCRFSKKEHLAAWNFDRDQSAAHPQFAFLIGRVFRL